jgi:hypothetical protein
MLLLDKELDETFHVGCFPLEVAFWVVGGSHVGLEEEEARIGKGPVVGDGELLGGLGFDVFDDAFEVGVLADEFEGGARADTFDGVEVVTAEEDAEVDELEVVSELHVRDDADSYLFPLHTQAFEHLIQMNLQDRFLALLAEGQMSQQNR